jgi:hypothetical protein
VRGLALLRQSRHVGTTVPASADEQESVMPRYLVERQFPDGLDIPMDDSGAKVCQNVVVQNAEETVTWVHSYVTPDRRTTFCIYDGPDPEAIRRAADRNGLPVERITEVRVLDPYFYTEA